MAGVEQVAVALTFPRLRHEHGYKVRRASAIQVGPWVPLGHLDASPPSSLLPHLPHTHLTDKGGGTWEEGDRLYTWFTFALQQAGAVWWSACSLSLSAKF